jgi:hypothetical protein
MPLKAGEKGVGQAYISDFTPTEPKVGGSSPFSRIERISDLYEREFLLVQE